MPKTLFIIAGEPSGDLHGSKLIETLKRLSPGIRVCGMGGSLMQNAGAQLFFHIEHSSVMGFAEVIKRLPRFLRIYKILLQKLDLIKPDAVILIDYPGFNLRFAKQVKRRNLPLIYYISPQVWAWAKHRAKLIKRVVGLMLVFFDFEKDLYRKYGVDTVFVGHPLIESTKPSMSKQDVIKHLGLCADKVIIALLPGSRKTEISQVLPIMLSCTKLLIKKLRGNAQFLIIKSPVIEKGLYESILKDSGGSIPVKIVNNLMFDAIWCADLAIVASGTATLQTAILGTPMVIVYKGAFLTWLIARALIKIPYIGLVNIVAGKKIVPEFIQFKATARNIVRQTLALLNSPSQIALMEQELTEVKKKLGPPGASERAANEILSFLSRRTDSH